MSKKMYGVLVVLVAGIFIFAACAPSSAPADSPAMAEKPAEAAMAEPTTDSASALEGQLQIAGSTTVQPLAEIWASDFMDVNPNVTIDVQGGGSSVGVTSAGEGTVDIGEASREVKQSEFDTFPNLKVFVVAYDGIAIVVNPGVELPTLSKEQVRRIFAGEIRNFSEVGGSDAPIIVVSREEGSGTRAAFQELVMAYKNDVGETVEDPITENALLQQSNGQVRTVVAETPDSIAYLSFGFLDDSTKRVPIDNVEPTVANVKNGSYSIYRPLNMLTNGDPSPLTQAFLDYVLSDAGQQVAVDEGYMTAN